VAELAVRRALAAAVLSGALPTPAATKAAICSPAWVTVLTPVELAKGAGKPMVVPPSAALSGAGAIVVKGVVAATAVREPIAPDASTWGMSDAREGIFIPLPALVGATKTLKSRLHRTRLLFRPTFTATNPARINLTTPAVPCREISFPGANRRPALALFLPLGTSEADFDRLTPSTAGLKPAAFGSHPRPDSQPARRNCRAFLFLALDQAVCSSANG